MDIDIINELGGVASKEDALKIFRQNLDDIQLARISAIENPEVLKRIANAIVLCNPARVFINTGSPEDRQIIRDMALEKKEERPLAMKGHTIHFDLAQEQGRIIDRTYYIADPGECHRQDQQPGLSAIGTLYAHVQTHDQVDRDDQ